MYSIKIYLLRNVLKNIYIRNKIIYYGKYTKVIEYIDHIYYTSDFPIHFINKISKLREKEK